MAHGQPTPAQKFELLGAAVKRPLDERAIFVHPAEVVALRGDMNVHVSVLDVRREHDFNLFHIGDSTRLDASALDRREVVRPLLDQPSTTVNVLVGTGEAAAVEAWKVLKAQGVNNLYVLEGGINRWLELYAPPACAAERMEAGSGPERSAWRFAYATGDRLPSARPEVPTSHSFRLPCEPVSRADEPAHDEIVWPAYTFLKRVKLQTRSVVKGGCG
jgi:hypothetical protein